MLTNPAQRELSRYKMVYLVNLFASQLRLTGGQGNTAEFFPEHGLAPYLNLKLFTYATKTTRNRVNVDPISSEINDPFSAYKQMLIVDNPSVFKQPLRALPVN